MFSRVRFVLLVVPTVFLLGTMAQARTIVVHPGESIRTALAAAHAGDRIQVQPGIYHEGAAGDLNALSITASGIELVGVPAPNRPVVLENAGGQSFGIWVSPVDSIGAGPEEDPEHPPCGLSGARITGFSLSGFTLKGFLRDGAHLTCVDDFALTANVADGDGLYGFFPVASRNGVLANNEALNVAADAAIYVGQSDNVAVTANRVHDSLLGIEIENSRNCAVIGNEVYGNTLGILVDIMPFLEIPTQSHTLLSSNEVHDNNRPNTAEPDDVLGIFPAGIGILLTGADVTTVRKNIVTGNQFVGIGVASFCFELALLGQPCEGLDIDPQSDGNRILSNFVRGNGTVPVPNPILDGFRADLSWDGTGSGNCWKANAFNTSVPSPLPSC